MSVAQIPWAIIETALFTLILYFFVGYYHGAGEASRPERDVLLLRAEPSAYVTLFSTVANLLCAYNAGYFFCFYLLSVLGRIARTHIAIALDVMSCQLTQCRRHHRG
jgi:ABC-type multidrug transport system permease subunit